MTISRWVREAAPIGLEYHPKLAEIFGLSERELRQESSRSYAGEYVQSREAFEAWQDAVSEAKGMGGEVRTLLVLIGMAVDRRFWVSVVTTDELGKKFLGKAMVEQFMPGVLASGYVERLGKAEYALVMKFPER